jgi:ubiquinone/menaquinone biosynthesis C-methylase UbiE
MPVMSRAQQVLCRSAPWRAVAGGIVLPWALQGYEPTGEVLEIGAGSGAMAAEVLRRCPDVRLTATDYDPVMVEAAAERVAPFGDRARAQQADATALPFGEASFDAVLSWVMLHHTVEWERAVAECVRVLRPGGHLVAYDLLALPGRHGDDHVRKIRLDELRAVVADLPVDVVRLGTTARLVVRFHLRRR